MHARTNPKIRLMLHTITGLGLAGMAQATLLLYEGFDYTSGTPAGPTSNGFALNGQSGGTGMSGSWTAFSNSGTITVYDEGTLSGVNLNNTGPIALAYDGTVASIPTTGGYFGMSASNGTDHMIISRPLAAGFAAANFTDGAITWFSFVSVRGYVANPAGLKLALGKGALIEDRGFGSTGEAIGGGGGLGTSVRNGYKVYPQFWDNTTGSPGETAGTFTNYDVLGIETGVGSFISAPYVANGYDGTPAIPTGQSDGLDSMLLDHGGEGIQPNGARNIIVGKIEWHDGIPDVITTVVFRESDSLTEAAFNGLVSAQPNLSSANWSGIQPDLDQSQFDTISLAGGKWFGDEVRLATTFDDVLGLTVIPEPSAVLLSLLGVGAFFRRRR